MKTSDSSLRAARQKRIAERKKAENVEEKKSQQSYKFTQKESKTEEVKTEDTPQTLTASIVDPKTISNNAEITMHLYGENTVDPHWLVCADGKPVAEIRLSDQEVPEEVSNVFATDQYKTGIITAASQLPLSEILTEVKARPYLAAVESSEIVKDLKEKLENNSKTELRKARAELRNDMLNMLNFVVSAQTRNFIAENALKCAMFGYMTEAGISGERSLAIIEGAWQDSANDFFETTFDQASKWMDLSPEAFAELREQIESTKRNPLVEAETKEESVDVKFPKESANIPLATYASAAVDPSIDNEKDTLREKLSFRKRSLNKQMNNR